MDTAVKTSGRPRTSFYPDYIVPSVDRIDFDHLAQRGISTIFIDLDGTVVKRGTYDVSCEIRGALDRSGMAIYIATNRPKSRDLRNLKIDLGAAGVIHPVGVHGKPSTKYYKAALAEHNLIAAEVAMIGDRYLQDILGANRAGLRTILVDKLGRPDSLMDRMFTNCEQLITKRLARSYTAAPGSLELK